MKSTVETDWENVTQAWSWAGQHAYNQELWQLSYPVACIPWHRGWFQEAAWLHAEVIDALESSQCLDDVETDALLLGSLHASHAYFRNYLDQTEQVETSAAKSLAYLKNG